MIQSAELAGKLNQLEYMSLKVLRMTEEELPAYIAELSLENPVIIPEEGRERDRSAFSVRASGKDMLPFEEWQSGVYDRSGTAEEYLIDQVLPLGLKESTERTVRALFALLDDDGYLKYEEKELCALLRASKTAVKEAVTILKSLDPAGVGARDMEEALLLQLERFHGSEATVALVSGHHLGDLAAGRYRKISALTSLKQESIWEAEHVIASLRPKPFSFLHTGKEPEYIYPSVRIEADEGGVRVCLSEEQPYFTVDPYYETLYGTCEDKETRRYLAEKLSRARLLRLALEKRSDTLLRCACLLAEKQSAFFLRGEAPVPLTRKELAEQMQVSPSTVTRTLQGKYLLSGGRVYPFSYFFGSRELGTSPGATDRAVKEQILAVIADEPPDRPYSDEQIAGLLRKKHFSVSRRTIAKYRKEALIPSSYKRAAENKYAKKKEAVKHEQ